MSQLAVQELAQNMPARSAAPERVPGSAAGLFTISDDFDEPLDDLFEVFHTEATDLISGGRSEYRL